MEMYRNKREISCGAILYTDEGDDVKVLLLEQDNAHYKRTGSEAKKVIIDIGPSGRHNGEKETYEETAMREIYEETGLKGLRLDKGFEFDLKYEFDTKDEEGKDVHVIKTRRYWCAKLPDDFLKNIRISPEHKRYWMEPIEDAIRMNELEDSKKDALMHFKKYLADHSSR